MDQMTWNIESEYPSIQSPQFATDVELVTTQTQTLAKQIQNIQLALKNETPASAATIELIQQASLLSEKTTVVLYNMWVYLDCQLAVDAKSADARKSKSQVIQMRSQLEQITTPLFLFIKQCSTPEFEQILKHPDVAPYRFQWEQERRDAIHALSEKEEVLANALAVNGLTAWGELYKTISGKGQCVLKFENGKTETVGIAQAQVMRADVDEDRRKAAWMAVEEYWKNNEEPAAAILNSLAGWRISLNTKRSSKKQQHFLDPALHGNRICRETLDALIEACSQNREKLHRIFPIMSGKLGKEKMHPWDMYAPNPDISAQTRPFGEGYRLVQSSFEKIDPAMGAFAKMAFENKWIDSRLLPNKAGGAFCTKFYKSLEPRVFMSYAGSAQDLITLAHELGHGFHTWVLRDLPRAQQDYPMTLAETASVFAETALREDMINSTSSESERSEFMWNQIQSVLAFLINIPARYEFEKEFYERRQTGTVTATELSDLMDATWTKWYGGHLSQNERMFWASKLHFSISDRSFYNFPYAFGYLFSLSIYARRQSLGKDFMKTYIAILQDTGRMTAEDLIQKHLGEDIRQIAFWQKALDVVHRQVDLFLR